MGYVASKNRPAAWRVAGYQPMTDSPITKNNGAGAHLTVDSGFPLAFKCSST